MAAGGRWEGKAPRATLWDVAVRSIIACCTDHVTQTISDILSPLKTSLKNLHELDTWQYSWLDMAKAVRLGHCAAAQRPHATIALVLWRFSGPANSV